MAAGSRLGASVHTLSSVGDGGWSALVAELAA